MLSVTIDEAASSCIAEACTPSNDFHRADRATGQPAATMDGQTAAPQTDVCSDGWDRAKRARQEDRDAKQARSRRVVALKYECSKD
ncbi:hypothetical protein PHYPSEUDO_012374 [Phytophthora pseudosyringae]|uniref:Uncharacterized protein n=1 Tax=Phytophthora pseudosyringae TaxID=221518 RepID=A0A8T1V9H5_9STRA|nr:hypothetical protein PHYPSEUDO_012374 [Phytophthora pseudosyringae]